MPADQKTQVPAPSPLPVSVQRPSAQPARQDAPGTLALQETQVNKSHQAQPHAVSTETVEGTPAPVPKSPDASVDTLLCLELFAGSCRLSSAIQSVGFQALAIDSRECATFKVLQVDLLQESGRALVLDLIRQRRVWYVHLAPPCATSSQARGIPTPKWGPVPLRSFDWPDGLPGLNFVDRSRVQSANRLYSFCAEVILACQKMGCFWSVENPAGSHFWNTSPIRLVRRLIPQDIFHVQFHHCCFGGERMKLTALWCNMPSLRILGMLCHPGLRHRHKKWGRTSTGAFATSQEAAYPVPLCVQWANALLEHARRLGYSRVDASDPRVPQDQANRANLRATLGLLPKSSRMPRAVDPFVDKFWVQLEGQDLSSTLPGKSAQHLNQPKASQVLQVARDNSTWWAEVGLHCEPPAFMCRARAFIHPQARPPPVPPILHEVVHDVSCNLAGVHRERCQFLSSLCQRAKELAVQEHQDHSEMDQRLQAILEGKRLRLLDELLQAAGFPDSRLVADIRSGFKLTGWLPRSGHMQAKTCPPTLSKQQLLAQARSRNQEIWDSIVRQRHD